MLGPCISARPVSSALRNLMSFEAGRLLAQHEKEWKDLWILSDGLHFWGNWPRGCSHESLEQMSPEDIGERLRWPVKTAKVHQEGRGERDRCGAHDHWSRSNRGQRRARMSELQKLREGLRNIRKCAFAPGSHSRRLCSAFPETDRESRTAAAADALIECQSGAGRALS